MGQSWGPVWVIRYQPMAYEPSKMRVCDRPDMLKRMKTGRGRAGWRQGHTRSAAGADQRRIATEEDGMHVGYGVAIQNPDNALPELEVYGNEVPLCQIAETVGVRSLGWGQDPFNG